MSTYSTFLLSSDKIMEDNSLYKNYLQMDLILKKLFTIKNPRPIIDFLNAIYGDDISYDAKISYSDKEIINRKRNSAKLISFYADMYITVTDGNEIYEYEMEFQTKFDKEISVRIFRYSFERAIKIADFSKTNEFIKLKMPDPYLILLEETSDVGDSIKLQIEFGKGKAFIYDIKVLKYWTYDLEKLYKDNMYLLYPLQIFRLRKRMNEISSSKAPENFKEAAMLKLYHEMRNIIEKTLKAIDKAYTDGRIEIEDYDEMT